MSIHYDKELWIVAKPNGKLVTAWCSCMAGASRCCNHIIATLYKVEYANLSQQKRSLNLTRFLKMFTEKNKDKIAGK